VGCHCVYFLANLMPTLTAGEECQLAAKTLSVFADPRKGAITAPFINSAMGIAIFKGDEGVALVRLKTGEWSAPCAISCESPHGGIQPGQDTIILFMSEKAIFSLVGQTPLVLNKTHRFEPGPLYGGTLNLDETVDVYAYVRYNDGFTPAELIMQYMTGWTFKEDAVRHGRWHGKNATWFDVLTNKISVDRSSVGNALYLVLNLGTSGSGGGANLGTRNYAKIDEWSQQQRHSQTQRPPTLQSLQQASELTNNNTQNSGLSSQGMYQMPNSTGNQFQTGAFNAQAMYEMQLKQQEMQQAMMMQNLQNPALGGMNMNTVQSQAGLGINSVSQGQPYGSNMMGMMGFNNPMQGYNPNMMNTNVMMGMYNQNMNPAMGVYNPNMNPGMGIYNPAMANQTGTNPNAALMNSQANTMINPNLNSGNPNMMNPNNMGNFQ
jgi:hypothetical protein